MGYAGLYFKLDIERSSLTQPLKNDILLWARSSLTDLGELSLEDEQRVLGRYGRWVKRIKKIDVLIAYTAIVKDYILATGDLEQMRFYVSVYSSRNPKSHPRIMFIPVRWLV